MAFDHQRFFQHFFKPEPAETDAALSDIERYLEVKLPKALSTLYRLTPIRHTGLLSLHPLDDLEIDDSILYFGRNVQQNVRVGVPLAAENPPLIGPPGVPTLNDWFAAFVLSARTVAPPSKAMVISTLGADWVPFEFEWLSARFFVRDELVTDGRRVGAKTSIRLEAFTSP